MPESLPSVLVLSLFPGIGLLDRAFEEEGFCVVRGPDVLWGGDIRRFHPPSGVFDGVIGGDPCQAHMRIASLNRALGREPRYPDMTPEFCRVVGEAAPIWWLRENVPAAPSTIVDGYVVSAIVLNNRWVGGVQHRKRGLWFGSREGLSLDLSADVVALEAFEWEASVLSGNGSIKMRIDRGGLPRTARSVAKMARDARRPWGQQCQLQGLPEDFLADSPLTVSGKKRVLANGVPLPMGRAIASAVKRALGVDRVDLPS